MHVASDVILRIEFAAVAFQREKNLYSTKYKYTLQLFFLYHISIFYFCFSNYIMTRRFKKKKKNLENRNKHPHNYNLEGQELMNVIIVWEVNQRVGIGVSEHVFVLSQTKPITFELLICVLSLAHNVYCGVSHSISLVVYIVTSVSSSTEKNEIKAFFFFNKYRSNNDTCIPTNLIHNTILLSIIVLSDYLFLTFKC